MLANHLWQSTAFAILAAALTLVMRRNRASVRYWVWLTASLKFLLPFDALSSLARQVPQAAAAIPVPPAATVIETVAQPFTATALAPTPSGSSLVPWLAAIWLCGFAAVLMWWTKRWRGVAASPALEPGVFGIFRPKLMLPRGIERRLTPEQLRAVVAHEMCHLRRRDNLFAAIHMVVEALFWFHPLVWWIGARLVEERERACDEEVVRQGADPEAYASGILEVCKFYLELPLVCVSGVTGADLNRRIEAIMTARVLNGLTPARKAMLAGAAAVVVAVPVFLGFAQAQEDRFEVASVKPAPPGITGVRMQFTPGGGVRIQNAALQNIIEMAFDVQRFQVAGAPSWIASEQFVIEGQPPAGSTAGNDVARHRLQRLLAERFHLAVRRESREGPVYALTVVKGGHKMKESDTGDGITGSRPGHIRASKTGLPLLTHWLSMVTGKPVIDRTGLAGTYAFDLSWTPDGGSLPGKGGGPIAEIKAQQAAAADPPDPNGPSLFTALQEQLGLRLESGRGPVETIVIERVERPSAN